MYDLIDATFMLKPCVYLLISDGEIVYVGQTIDIRRRFCEHSKKIFYDAVKVVPCAKEELNSIEAKLIGLHKPRYNKRGLDKFIYTKPVDLVALGLVKPKASWRRF